MQLLVSRGDHFAAKLISEAVGSRLQRWMCCHMWHSCRGVVDCGVRALPLEL